MPRDTCAPAHVLGHNPTLRTSVGIVLHGFARWLHPLLAPDQHFTLGGFRALLFPPLARHSTAVVVAYKQKMDLALGVALGSSTQIAIFVIPLMVLIGWAIGQPLDLFFGPFPTAITFLSSLLVFIVVQNGETNWLEGVMLLFSYAFICYAFFYL